MNYTEVTASGLGNHYANGIRYNSILSLTIGAVNIGMAAGQLVLSYLTYRASRRKMPTFVTLRT
jgi:hypothetical protein